MIEIVYIYNVFLIMLYTLTFGFVLTYALNSEEEKKYLFFVVSLYLVFFIFDNLILSMTEIFKDFGNSYNQHFLGVPFVKTVIYLVNNMCQFWIVAKLRKETPSVIHYCFICITFIWMVFPILNNSPLRVFMYYLPNQLLLIYTGIYAKRNLTSLNISNRNKRYLKTISHVGVIFGFLIIVEDLFVIFNIDSYDLLNLRIQNRNICEDMFTITVCFLIMKYILSDWKIISNVEEQLNSLDMSKNINNNSTLDLFYEKLHLTEREQEIFSLLLEHKSNQEIADQLYLSVGTVKTHVHNIFMKLEITKRNQLFEVYSSFENQHPEL